MSRTIYRIIKLDGADIWRIQVFKEARWYYPCPRWQDVKHYSGTYKKDFGSLPSAESYLESLQQSAAARDARKNAKKGGFTVVKGDIT